VLSFIIFSRRCLQIGHLHLRHRCVNYASVPPDQQRHLFCFSTRCRFHPRLCCIYPDLSNQHLVYTGARNGTIERFDMRMAKCHSQKLFDTRFADGPRSPVLHLNVIRQSELFISHLNGDVSCGFC
jgi:hypothetical protein